MSSQQETIAITAEQEASAAQFLQDLLVTVERGLEVWLDQKIKTVPQGMRPLDADEARLELPAAGIAYAVTMHSKSPLPVFVASQELAARAVAAAAGRPAEEGEATSPSLEQHREALQDFGSFLAAGAYDRALQRVEEGRVDADLQTLELTDSSWQGGEDPLLGSERFAVFQASIEIGRGGAHPFQLFLPWGYAASLFQYVGASSAAVAAGTDRAAPVSGATTAARADAPAKTAFVEENMSIAALVKRGPPPPPPAGAPPRIQLKELHRFRPKRELPIRYMRGHQMRETRELSPVYLVGSEALMPVLTQAWQDREVFHLEDGRELAQRLDGAALPAAVIVHCPEGHEPWVTGWVGATKFRENLDRQPVVVILDDASKRNVSLCGRMGLVNVFSSDTEPDQLLRLLAPHLD